VPKRVLILFLKKSLENMLVKLTLGVNFINILHERFLHKSALRSFSLVHYGFVIFWQKDIGKKALVKCW